MLIINDYMGRLVLDNLPVTQYDLEQVSEAATNQPTVQQSSDQ
jgi:hypothetical protein